MDQNCCGVIPLQDAFSLLFYFSCCLSWRKDKIGCQTRRPACIFLPFIKSLRDDGPAVSNCTEIFAEITGRLRLGTDNSVAAGVDTATVWYGPCQHWWQLGLTSSQNQPKSFRASVTRCVCGEFVTGDCFSDGINRHHCPPPLMALEASSDANILWAHGNPFSHTQTPYWHISGKLERLPLPRRGLVREAEGNRQAWPSSSALLCCFAWGFCQHKLLQRHR